MHVRRSSRPLLGVLAALLIPLWLAALAPAGAVVPTDDDGSVPLEIRGADTSYAKIRTEASDRSPGSQHHPSGRVDQGTGQPTLFECDIFYMGPDGRVWTPWDCNPDNPLVSEGVIYHGTSDLPPLIEAPFVQHMIREMNLTAPNVASTPNDPNTSGAVGLPVWFWVANPGPSTTGPNSVTATAGAMSVTATARLSAISIDTGDGTTIECNGPGTPYPGTGVEPSPDCGHVYEKTSESAPGGLYPVHVRAHWRVQWTDNAGHSTTMDFDLESDKQLRIGQLEAVRTPASLVTDAR